MSYLRYLCLFAYSGSNIYCVVFLLCLSLSCVLCTLCSNVYLPIKLVCLLFKVTWPVCQLWSWQEHVYKQCNNVMKVCVASGNKWMLLTTCRFFFLFFWEVFGLLQTCKERGIINARDSHLHAYWCYGRTECDLNFCS